MLYDPDAYPLVYGGEGGLGAYFTLPPDHGVPFAIINLPHSAFDNVWQWLALPHEIGHDIYASINNLQKEMEDALVDAMKGAVDSGQLNIPDINFGNIYLSGKDFISLLWKSWANEAQADIIGLLNCGGAAIASLQQIIGFSNLDSWVIKLDFNGQTLHIPEPHPTSYIRNILNIEALKIIETSFMNNLKVAPDIGTRFDSLKPNITKIIWYYGDTNTTFTEIEKAQIEKSAKIAASIILNHKFPALGTKSYLDIITFKKEDQEIVNKIVPCLLKEDPIFPKDFEPRHVLAATVIAFEQKDRNIRIINKTFKHFI